MTISDGGEPDSVVPQKLAAQVARQLEDEISERGWPIGEVLGSESELLLRFRVSRSILREAIRLLEHHGVARTRSGPGGGLVVCAPDASPAVRALVIYLEYIGVSVENLVGARLQLEPLAARLAADRITEDGISGLRELVSREGPGRENTGGNSALSSDKDFYTTLGQLSGNPVLQLFGEVLTMLTDRYVQTSDRITAEMLADVKAKAAVWHTEIAEAVVSSDGATAQMQVTKHLEEVRAWMVGQQIHTDARRMRTRPVDPDPKSGPKLAEVVAGRIHDDITTGDWQVGEILGSEADLLTRYAVSRAVLREALHLLDYHNVARMRRGPGGGLVILAPDPTASVRTIALYVDYRGLSPDDLRVVRETLELAIVESVTSTPIGPDALSAMHAALDHADRPGESGETFHVKLAELAANPVLALFLRVITGLDVRNGFRERITSTENDSAVRHVHEQILAAILAGDVGLAQHRMRRHLQGNLNP